MDPEQIKSPRHVFFQRHWTWWFMVGVLLLVAAIRIRLLTLPLERDEGEYAYAGQLMLQGIPPYELAYNMKFPGTYAAYALLMGLFGETPAGIHFGVLCLTTLTALMLFWLGKKMLDQTAGVVAATAYAVLAASPGMLGLAGHATHFVAFFLTAGLCVLWLARQNENSWLAFISGLLFGAAVLMKQHAAFVGAWAGVSFAVSRFRETHKPIDQRLLSIGMCAAGMFLPFVLCCLVLWHAGVFGKFWFWTIDYARQYALISSASVGANRFWRVLPLVTASTALLWLIASAGLLLIWFDDRLRGSRIWFAGFCLASALTVIPGFYFRVHYFLAPLPAVALLTGCAGSGFIWLLQKNHRPHQLHNSVMALYAVFLGATFFVNRDIWFIKTPDQASRTIYGLPLFLEAEKAAGFIHDHSASTARIAVLGSEPEIYFLARRHSATGYIYTYALMETQPFAQKMQREMIREIESAAPEFIVYVQGETSWGRYTASNQKIFKWWEGCRTNYTLVKPFGKTLSSTRSSDYELVVYRRNGNDGAPSVNSP
jgi:hypothetical protein